MPRKGTPYKKKQADHVTLGVARDAMDGAPSDCIDLPEHFAEMSDKAFLCSWTSLVADCVACGRWSVPTLLAVLSYVRDRFNLIHGRRTFSTDRLEREIAKRQTLVGKG